MLGARALWPQCQSFNSILPLKDAMTLRNMEKAKHYSIQGPCRTQKPH